MIKQIYSLLIKKKTNKKLGRNSHGLKYESNEIINIKYLKTQFKMVWNNYFINENNKLFYKKNLDIKLKIINIKQILKLFSFQRLKN